MKNFTVITATNVIKYETMGDLVVRNNGTQENIIPIKEAEKHYHGVMEKASYIRIKKRVNEVII